MFDNLEIKHYTIFASNIAWSFQLLSVLIFLTPRKIYKKIVNNTFLIFYLINMSVLCLGLTASNEMIYPFTDIDRPKVLVQCNSTLALHCTLFAMYIKKVRQSQGLDINHNLPERVLLQTTASHRILARINQECYKWVSPSPGPWLSVR